MIVWCSGRDVVVLSARWWVRFSKVTSFLVFSVFWRTLIEAVFATVSAERSRLIVALATVSVNPIKRGGCVTVPALVNVL